MNQKELWLLMMDRNHWSNTTTPYIRAYATLGGAVTLRYHNPESEKVLPAGTRVNVVMASRLGNVGITDKMNALEGYDARIQVDTFEFEGEDGAFWPEMPGMLVDIETREVYKNRKWK